MVIGSGDTRHFPALREATGYTGELFSDPGLEAFRLFHFKSGVGKVFGLKPLSRAFSALKAGFSPGSLQGSALQLGGAVVITTGGEIVYHYISQEAGDHPDPVTILTTVGQAV